MIKKVASKELKVGMFIHDLNSGWMDHGFFRSSFLIRKEGEIQQILRNGLHEVYIDTGKGLDVADAPSQQEVEQQIQERMIEHSNRQRPFPTIRTSEREEVAQALAIQVEASTVIQGMLMDVRLGKTIDAERAEPVVEKITDSIFRSPGTITSLCRIKERDNYTFQHSVSVCTLLVSFCRAMEMDRAAIHEAGIGGLMHDIGKMQVPDEVLNKPGRLTEAEFAIMKSHVTLGSDILQATAGLSATVKQIAAEHHERYDGTGYPLGLRGQGISLLGRMAAIVDVYDAITSNRIYHKAMEPCEAMKKLFEWSDHHFDQDLVQQFIQSLGIYPVGSLVRMESQRLAVVVEQNASNLLLPTVRMVHDIVRQQALPQNDLDLAAPGNLDHILAYEEPETWGIDVFKVLGLPKA